jgi:lambda family phage portal protein
VTPKFTGLIDVHGNPLRIRRQPLATYDGAADTNAATRRHWENADGLSAKAANSPEVRKKLRERARLEFDNGGNCKGAIETVAHHLVGTGPRLQLTLPDDAPADAAALIERKFRDWCDDPAVNFADKLRVMVESELRDGESFAVFVNNEAVEGPVKFDFRVVETEQIATPDLFQRDANAVDGIEFDASGNPVRYHLLKRHPGDTGWWTGLADYDRVPAAQVIHWFRPYRAGQARGIPRITPGLSLLAQIRGYTSSTLAAARLAAVLSGSVETTLSPEDGPTAVEAYDEVPQPDGSFLTMPAGWKMNFHKPEQPTSLHRDFKDTNLTEFGRAIHLPRNKVTGDSSGYNFSSARMDDMDAKGAIRIERNRLGVRVTDRIYKAWLDEALNVRGYFPDEIVATLPPVEAWTWTWQYDAFPAIDPVAEAQADETNLKNGLVTHGELLNARGVDWRDHFAAIAEQRALARELGIEDLLYPWLAKAAVPAMPARKPITETERDTVLEDEEEAAYAR